MNFSCILLVSWTCRAIFHSLSPPRQHKCMLPPATCGKRARKFVIVVIDVTIFSPAVDVLINGALDFAYIARETYTQEGRRRALLLSCHDPRWLLVLVDWPFNLHFSIVTGEITVNAAFPFTVKLCSHCIELCVATCTRCMMQHLQCRIRES